jgi:hypothetical protein
MLNQNGESRRHARNTKPCGNTGRQAYSKTHSKPETKDKPRQQYHSVNPLSRAGAHTFMSCPASASSSRQNRCKRLQASCHSACSRTAKLSLATGKLWLSQTTTWVLREQSGCAKHKVAEPVHKVAARITSGVSLPTKWLTWPSVATKWLSLSLQTAILEEN